MKDNHKTIATEQFKAYPELSAIHISSDDQVFHHSNYGDAVNHQRRLDESKKLVTITPKDLAEPAAAVEGTPDESWKNADIVEWLKTAGVEAKVSQGKAALLELVAGVAKEEEEEEEENDNE